MTAHYVYRLYDVADDLIYVGCTSNVGNRMRHHSNNQPWWSEVARIDVAERYDDRATGLEAERVAILAGQPRYNIKHAAGGVQTVECGGGTPAGYKRHRDLGEPACAECQAAHSEYTHARHARYLTRGSLTHGKVGTYVAGCRCDDCRDAGALHQRERRARLRAVTA